MVDPKKHRRQNKMLTTPQGNEGEGMCGGVGGGSGGWGSSGVEPVP